MRGGVLAYPMCVFRRSRGRTEAPAVGAPCMGIVVPSNKLICCYYLVLRGRQPGFLFSACRSFVRAPSGRSSSFSE